MTDARSRRYTRLHGGPADGLDIQVESTATEQWPPINVPHLDGFARYTYNHLTKRYEHSAEPVTTDA
jgi:hypothetical protein